jgi:hypothetical protein
MQEVIAIALTFLVSWFILKIVKKKSKKDFSKILYRQSDIHGLLKYFFSIPLSGNKKPSSQLTKHKEKSMIKVIVLNNEAYWVSDNTFYVAKAIDGEVQPHTAQPVNTNRLSKPELDKMLFILDSLKNGKKNDSGGTGNKRF